MKEENPALSIQKVHVQQEGLLSKTINACRMKTRHKGMTSVRSKRLVTSKIKKNKNHIIFCAGEPFYIFI